MEYGPQDQMGLRGFHLYHKPDHSVAELYRAVVAPEMGYSDFLASFLL